MEFTLIFEERFMYLIKYYLVKRLKDYHSIFLLHDILEVTTVTDS